jgi:ubiquinone/menaquinone biosynthesis C-methylase UbiE
MKKGRVKDFLSVLRDKGFETPQGATILDLGCGDAGGVKELRDDGYDAYGCDISLARLRHNAETQDFESKKIVRLILTEPYALPFDSDAFDFVISYQVFEHVQDYASTLAEVFRVLKPGGATLNIFPSRYRLLEPHGGIPFGTLIQQYWWLRLWTTLGIHGHQKGQGLKAREIANMRHEFLNNQTNYLTKREINQQFAKAFSNVIFCEGEVFKYSPKVHRFYSRALNALAPSLVPWTFGTFGSRAVLAIK